MTAVNHFWLGSRRYAASWASGVYPVDAESSLATSLSLIGGTSVEAPAPTDSLGVGLTITAGALETLLTGAQDLAAISTGLVLAGGDLTTVLRSADVGAESLSAALALVGGQLDTVLITHTPDTEALDVALVLTGGTLT